MGINAIRGVSGRVALEFLQLCHDYMLYGLRNQYAARENVINTESTSPLTSVKRHKIKLSSVLGYEKQGLLMTGGYYAASEVENTGATVERMIWALGSLLNGKQDVQVLECHPTTTSLRLATGNVETARKKAAEQKKDKSFDLSDLKKHLEGLQAGTDRAEIHDLCVLSAALCARTWDTAWYVLSYACDLEVLIGNQVSVCEVWDTLSDSVGCNRKFEETRPRLEAYLAAGAHVFLVVSEEASVWAEEMNDLECFLKESEGSSPSRTFMYRFLTEEERKKRINYKININEKEIAALTKRNEDLKAQLGGGGSEIRREGSGEAGGKMTSGERGGKPAARPTGSPAVDDAAFGQVEK